MLQAAEAWAPTPIELDNARLHDPSSFDIITTLVDIYGDSLFVAEYKCGSWRLLCTNAVLAWHTDTHKCVVPFWSASV